MCSAAPANRTCLERAAQISDGDPEDGRLLDAANRECNEWREAECNYRACEYGGGSGEQYDRIVCDLEPSSRRAIDLILR